jgi:hypothetical protein
VHRYYVSADNRELLAVMRHLELALRGTGGAIPELLASAALDLVDRQAARLIAREPMFVDEDGQLHG